MFLLKIRNIQICCLAILTAFLPVNAMPRAQAQELKVSPILNDETSEPEAGLSDLAIERGETEIIPPLQNPGALTPPDFEERRQPARRYDPEAFRKNTQNLSLGEGVRPARKIDFEKRLREENQKQSEGRVKKKREKPQNLRLNAPSRRETQAE